MKRSADAMVEAEPNAPVATNLHDMNLREFLPERAADVFASGGIADETPDIPDFEMRMMLIAGQMKWLVALNREFRVIYCEEPCRNLLDAIAKAESLDLLSIKEAGILRGLNRKANEAKHLVE